MHLELEPTTSLRGRYMCDNKEDRDPEYHRDLSLGIGLKNTLRSRSSPRFIRITLNEL
jgi:hypothetical protein